MRLYLVRHGETDWNKKGLIQGSSDIPLNEYGRELARITAKALRDIKFDKVYASPYIRAYETAQILCEHHKIPIIKDSRIKEFNFGNYEGKSIEILRTDKRYTEFWKCFSNPEEYVAKDGAETYDAFLIRIKSFIDEIIIPNQNDSDNILVAAHGAVIRGFLYYIKKESLKNLWNTHQKNCSVNIIDVRNDTFTLMEEGKLFY
ncbi:histidine phosphatase family protein [Anaerosacchariphilus polymeriproducens]|uniref:Histidine phosphatase family protein n=1 Tax=Anaerosacchariphilus polymeriproducens TaxID=1812858 RepID=A0A371ATY5_9FIRM|nr:histidine phosphatase family protein [Anaerosacchariphilus polymeriproducens]RDU23027.1 histidine phosphatase family protein [Anaerosacchariphilus polymeriproducens]